MGLSRGVLLIVIDGAGVNRPRCRQVAEAAWQDIADPDRRAIEAAAQEALQSFPSLTTSAHDLALTSLYPVHAEALAEETPLDSATALLDAIRAVVQSPAATAPLHRARVSIRRAARTLRLVPWTADTPFLDDLRNQNLTMPTSAAGDWAGFESLDPPVQGNSETGHQQIGNLVMAPQLPLQISASITTGEWFQNRALIDAIRHGSKPGRALNFTFMLSGVHGGDGRVHSAWNHLEAFVRLVFEEMRIPPEQVRMQAILDGRDSPPRASLEGEPGGPGYLDRLENLLQRYSAAESLAWVVGRSTGMDRDYREVNARADHLLMTDGLGLQVDGFDGVRRAVAAAHRNGATDQDVPPIAVRNLGGLIRTVEPGQSFVNLNFRSDRQRSKIAALCGAKEFLRQEVEKRGRNWNMDWLKPLPGLHICGIAEYHPVFASSHGVSVAFPARPHPENLLRLWTQLMPGEKYLLAAESIKAPHMGYFLRGRREEPSGPNVEDRVIVPSAGETEGILSDTDFHATPQMRNAEVAETVTERLAGGRYKLICCNLSAPDMLGHLLPDRFDEAVRACEATDEAIEKMVVQAKRHGWSVIVTADHGNIEDDGPAHSANDVLTTAAPPIGSYKPARRSTFQARLFDLSWTVAHLLGAGDRLADAFRPLAENHYEERYTGRSLIA